MTTLFNLLPGRVVFVKEGCGLVPITETIKDTVAFAAKAYAITATGIVLTEKDFFGVDKMLGVKPPGFHISAKAQRLQEALLLPLEEPYPDAKKLSRGLEDGFKPQYNSLF